MTSYVRINYDTGLVDMSTLRATPPDGVPAGENGYVVNKGGRRYRWVPVGANSLEPWQRNDAWPATVSVNTPEIKPTVVSTPLSDWKTVRTTALRAEARARIVAFAPEHMQLNMLARATELTNKVASGGTLTQEESAEVDAFKAVWSDHINPIRAAANVAEAAVADALDYEGVEAAFAAVAWPK